MIKLVPSIIITTGNKIINPYIKFGMIIGKGSVILTSDYNDTGNENIKSEKLIDGGLALGINAAVGLQININHNVSIFWGLNMINLFYTPIKSEVTKYEHNGIDELSILETSMREIEYVDSYNYDYRNSAPETEPNKQLKWKLPFGSLGINLGVRIAF